MYPYRHCSIMKHAIIRYEKYTTVSVGLSQVCQCIKTWNIVTDHTLKKIDTLPSAVLVSSANMIEAAIR